MITATDIHKYGIENMWQTTASINDLFSGSMNDPSLAAEDMAVQNGPWYDIGYAIGGLGFNIGGSTVVVQVTMFKTREGLERYREDGIVLFDERE